MAPAFSKLFVDTHPQLETPSILFCKKALVLFLYAKLLRSLQRYVI
jgi:hypothetical protein